MGRIRLLDDLEGTWETWNSRRGGIEELYNEASV
jgi:hypothetical protein